MSGGRFNYVDSSCKREIFGWDGEFSNVFGDREISEIIWDVFNLIHEYDLYVSGDNNKSYWIDAKNKFKNKWLKNDSKRIKKTIDDAIEDVRKELYETYNC